jgi:hypothetical protein
MRNTILVIVAVLALAGCGGKTPVGEAGPAKTSATTAAPSTPASTTPPAPSKPAVLSRQQAAAKYLALVKPINAVYDEPQCKDAEDYMVNGGSWDRSTHGDKHADQILRSCYKRLIPMYEKNIRVFQSTPWPADAKQDMADLISLDQGLLHWLKQAVKGTTADQMYTALQTVPADDGSADRVRARFGLPGRSN